MKRVLLLIAVVGMFSVSCDKEEVKIVDSHQGHNHDPIETRATPVFDGSEGTIVDSAETVAIIKNWLDNPVNTGDNQFIIPRSVIEDLMYSNDITDICFTFGEDSIYGIAVDQYEAYSLPNDTVSGVVIEDARAWKNVSGRDTSAAAVYIGIDIINDYLDNDCQLFTFTYGELADGKYTLLMGGLDSDNEGVYPYGCCPLGYSALLMGFGITPWKIPFIYIGMMCLQHFYPVSDHPCHNGIFC